MGSKLGRFFKTVSNVLNENGYNNAIKPELSCQLTLRYDAIVQTKKCQYIERYEYAFYDKSGNKYCYASGQESDKKQHVRAYYESGKLIGEVIEDSNIITNKRNQKIRLRNGEEYTFVPKSGVLVKNYVIKPINWDLAKKGLDSHELYDSENNLIATISSKIQKSETQITYNSAENEDIVIMVTLAVFADALTASRIADWNEDISQG
ncbi:hypothetical protein [Butyrivibrio sp. FCS014]|uniref:hypothetical protein n=1 Tax=Butyrivibrio sp. FCS014 TaxID=1408304 RepID=UPI0004666EF0|nr:hypothetical protein [Butyrivibrio sp. FCS014]